MKTLTIIAIALVIIMMTAVGISIQNDAQRKKENQVLIDKYIKGVTYDSCGNVDNITAKELREILTRLNQ